MDKSVKKFPVERSPVAGVMSLFAPDELVWSAVARASEQVDYLIVVDDSDVPQPPSGELPDNCVLLVNGSNRGLGYSLNQGCTVAVILGCTVIVTLDQDANLPDGYVAKASELLMTGASVEPRIAGVAPRTVNGFEHRQIHRFGDFDCSLGVVQSGLVLCAQAFTTVGGFSESLFIDGLEVDFVMRLHRMGYHVALDSRLDLDHSIGAPVSGTVLGRRFRSTNHNPDRVYYIARNSVYLATRNVWREHRWSISVASSLAKRALKIVLSEDRKWLKIRRMIRGISDGLLGRLAAIR